MIMGADKSQIRCGQAGSAGEPVGWFQPRAARLKTQEEPMFRSSPEQERTEAPAPEAHSGSFLFLLLFVLFGSSVDWTRPTHTGRAVCLIPSRGSDGNPLLYHPHRHTQNNGPLTLHPPQPSQSRSRAGHSSLRDTRPSPKGAMCC